MRWGKWKSCATRHLLFSKRRLCASGVLPPFSHVGIRRFICGDRRGSARHLHCQAQNIKRLGIRGDKRDSDRAGACDACGADARHGARRQYGDIVAVFIFASSDHPEYVHGIASIEHAYLESGKAMGMTKFQVLRMVESPLALSVIMAGRGRRSSSRSVLRQSVRLSARADSVTLLSGAQTPRTEPRLFWPAPFRQR